MKKLITVRSSSLAMTKMNTAIKTRCGKSFVIPAGSCSDFSGRFSIQVILNLCSDRNDWDRERDRDAQRDCRSSLSSGEASNPQEGPEESYPYPHHNHDPRRKTNGRYLSTDSPVTTHPTLFFLLRFHCLLQCLMMLSTIRRLEFFFLLFPTHFIASENEKMHLFRCCWIKASSKLWEKALVTIEVCLAFHLLSLANEKKARDKI